MAGYVKCFNESQIGLLILASRNVWNASRSRNSVLHVINSTSSASGVGGGKLMEILCCASQHRRYANRHKVRPRMNIEIELMIVTISTTGVVSLPLPTIDFRQPVANGPRVGCKRFCTIAT